MSNKIDFLCDYDSLHKSSSGDITGIISLSINELFFPEKEWNDSILTLVEWWAEGYFTLLTSKQDEHLFYFMDGPYAYRIKRGDDESILLLESRSFNTNKTVEIHNIDINGSVHNFIRFLNKIINYMHSKGFENSKITKLALIHKKLLMSTRF